MAADSSPVKPQFSSGAANHRPRPFFLARQEGSLVISSSPEPSTPEPGIPPLKMCSVTFAKLLPF